MGSLVREENLDRLRDRKAWDVVVIGGGATGLGSAFDAASRGYRTLLLEALDFAHGTSSRSTKLVHGGVRYLAQGNIALVREALHERGILLRNAPHLVHRRDFVVPAYHWLALPYYGIGLKTYDWMSGTLGLGRSRWIRSSEVVARMPAIRSQSLRGGVIYSDGQFDDSRLAITLARTFVGLGGTALNYVPVTGLPRRGGRIAEVVARDSETGAELRVEARSVINAAGVCADTVRRMDDPAAPALLSPSQGAHLVVDSSFFPGETALLVPHTDDGRVLFAIPWHGRVLVGTTDTPVAEVASEPRPLRDEIKYLLSYLDRYLERAPNSSDVLSMFAGLRPLLGRRGGLITSRLSREHIVIVSESGLVTVTGGKWTTYRRMAADAVDHAMKVGSLAATASSTASLKLHGWREPELDGRLSLAVHGSDAAGVAALCEVRPEWSQPIHRALPYMTGEAIWAARHESARCVGDVLARRTRALFLDARASIEAAPKVAALLAEELGRDAAWQIRQAADFEKLAATYLPDS
jgi:glycerol-3-phosphate dehydrogenase